MATPLIVIPTYNEAANIGKLIEKLCSMNLAVLIVDDNSPDGTSDIVRGFSKKYPQLVNLITRMSGKNGRGSATLDGFNWALERDFDPIFEMDADFSHDPDELPRFFEKIKEVDVVVGSRYLRDSRILHWPLPRRIFSRLANSLARFILKLPLSDFTNGYRCYRRSALELVDTRKITEKGYIVLSYLAAQLAAKGCRFGEVPTRFVNRQRGASQLSRKEIFQALRGILRLRNYVKANRIR